MSEELKPCPFCGLKADHAARVAELTEERDALKAKLDATTAAGEKVTALLHDYKAKLDKAVTGLKDARCILAVAMKEANRDGAGYHEKAELDAITEIIQACTADGKAIERTEGK